MNLNVSLGNYAQNLLPMAPGAAASSGPTVSPTPVTPEAMQAQIKQLTEALHAADAARVRQVIVVESSNINDERVLPNGNRYRGEWRNDQPNGRGVLTYPASNARNHFIYEGEVQNGEPHGRGKMTYAAGGNTQSIEGIWINGEACGQGIKIFTSGHRYVGTLHNALPEGQGRFTFGSGPNLGDVYEGGFHDGDFQGNGKYFWSEGSRYEGEWRNGKKHGHGIFYYSSRSGAYNSYEGGWENNKEHGPGFFIDTLGGRQNCTYVHGVQQSSCCVML